jgi:hypothetical protein
MPSDLSNEELERRLRVLPPPPVPAGLEARLLSAVPNAKPTSTRHWPIWVGVAVGVAAACLIAVVAWPRHVKPVPESPQPEVVHEVSPQSFPDPEGLPAFSWPLEESSPLRVSTALPADQFD